MSPSAQFIICHFQQKVHTFFEKIFCALPEKTDTKCGEKAGCISATQATSLGSGSAQLILEACGGDPPQGGMEALGYGEGRGKSYRDFTASSSGLGVK